MSLIITAVFDGPLPGGAPSGVELYATSDIADLSIFGIGSANNGTTTSVEEFIFPPGSLSAGSFLYVANDITAFQNFMGFAPDFVSSAMSVNGNDVIELFRSGVVIDRFGELGVNGTDEPWEYRDGWASRQPGTTADPSFELADWVFSSPDALDNETSNSTASFPVPLQTYTPDGGGSPSVSFVINEIDVDQLGTDSAEFIEIYDGGVGNASLDGVSVVLFNGNGDIAYSTINLTGRSTDQDGYFVIGSASVPGVDLVQFSTNGLQNGADAIALYSGTPPDAPTTSNLIDAIVYGTRDATDTDLLIALGQTTQFDEGENLESGTQALARVPNGDGTFVAQAPTPGGSNSLTPSRLTLIHEVQGEVGTGNLSEAGVDDVSPLAGQRVTVRAIVTADFQSGVLGDGGDLNGFYIQEEESDYDFNDLTSEGLFVSEGAVAPLDVAVGDLVEVTGTVSEFFGQTQLTASDISVLSRDQALPSAVAVDFPTANVMVWSGGDLVANLEAYEGMRITIPEAMSITEMFNLDRFGQLTVAADGRPVQFTQTNAPDAFGYAAHLRDVASRTIVVDDGQTIQAPDPIKILDGGDGVLTSTDVFRMGDTISDITGVVGFSFGEFRLQSPTGTYARENQRPSEPNELYGELKIASFNVLNYFTTLDLSGVTTKVGLDPRGADSVDELDRQATKLVNAIVEIDADILGLVEIENDFSGETFALKDLVSRINLELGDTVYGFVDPGVSFVGRDAISNALIYKIDEVGLLGDMEILENFNGVDFLDPLSAGRSLNRPAIAQTFEDLDTQETITISVNHLKSKGSASGLSVDDDQGDGQGRNNATRSESVQVLADWLATDPTGQGGDNYLILGDLNAYAMEDPITALKAAGFTDLVAEEIGSENYSFVFDGQIGTLDYAFANGGLLDHLVGATEWHINVDEADAIDYNLDLGRNPSLFDADTPARNSDHDPVIVSFDLSASVNRIKGTDRVDTLTGTGRKDVIRAEGGSDSIDGGGADDILFGGAGGDTVTGGNGDDTAEGGVGFDLLEGNRGSDLLLGGDGNDTIFGVRGGDEMYGEEGRDRISGGQGFDHASGGAGNDTIRGGNGNDTVEGGEGNDRLFGGRLDDVIDGDEGDDQIFGQQSNDKINGGEGNDSIEGGSGRDSIDGDEGNDQIDGGTWKNTLSGGAGEDTFVLRPGYDRNVITDFEVGSDILLLDPALWTGTLSPTEVVAQFGGPVSGGVALDFGVEEFVLLGIVDEATLTSSIAFL